MAWPKGRLRKPTKVADATEIGISDAPAQFPASVTMSRLYAYWADDGSFRQWQPGSVATDPNEIADLIERAAPIEEVM